MPITTFGKKLPGRFVFLQKLNLNVLQKIFLPKIKKKYSFWRAKNGTPTFINLYLCLLKKTYSFL